MHSPPPPRDPRGLDAAERRELRDTALTFAPAIVIAFVLRWSLVAHAGWVPRRALIAGIGVGIVLAVLVQRSLQRSARP